MKEGKPTYEDLLAKINVQEQKMNKVKRLYLFISRINQIIVRAQDRNQLFKEVCNIAVEIGGFQMAWIGMIDPDTQDVIPVGMAGYDQEYLSMIKTISTKIEKETGRGPAGIAIRKGSYYVCNAIEDDSNTELWRVEALKRDYRSLIALPIKMFDKTIGVFMIYAAEKNYFDDEEISLLNNATTDVSFALEFFEEEIKRKQAEEAVVQSEKRFHTLTEVSPVGIYRTDLTGATTYVNQRWTQIVGITYDESMGSGWYIAIHPEDRIKLYNEWKKVVGNRQRSVLEYRFMKADGTIVWVIGQATPETNAENKIIGLIGTITDITQRKQAEDKFVKTSKKMEAIIEAIPDMMFEIDLEGTIFNYYTPKNDLLLLPPSEFLDKKIIEVLPADAAAVCLSALKEANEKGFSRGKQYSLELSIGKCWFELSLAPMKEDESKEKHFIVISRDITEQKIADEALLKNKERYSGLLDNLEARIVVYDAHGTIIMCNSKSAELLGYTTEELMSGNNESLKWNFLNEDYSEMQIENHPINQIIHSKRAIKNFPLGIIEPIKKTIVWVLVNGFPMLDDNGDIQEVVISFIDVTKQKMMDFEIKKAKDQAEAANKSKTDFLANMSHEIRTPLNGIIGFTSLLMESKLAETQLKYMLTINESATTLMDIVNDILDFSKIEAGKLELKIEEIDLFALTTQVISLFKYQASQKQIDLVLNIEENVPQFLFVDTLRIKQIIINLLGNAIKFTQKGEIRLEIKTILPVEDHFINLCFSVKDTGIGIQPKNQDKIFHSFEQEDNSTSRQFGGTGLGLAISNQLLSLMSSTLQLESTFGQGSNFYFNIRLKKSDMQNQQLLKTNDESIMKNILGTKKVLIVEDNRINMFLAKTLIQKIIPDCLILEAIDGDEAIEQYKIQQPDIILMDIQMPNKNGFEATYEIRKIEQNSFTPIVALTAGIFVEEKEQCLKSGMNDYITKPIIVSDLETILFKWLSD
ncbi:PAS domain S-box protein [Flavobacterium undicola]|uniref:PAS domain S-box protein n=1 Tax=Flavobacterium undicola TaxID=1932779 RepID=UPI00137860D8|nr:PAS domain S-box protein [Flavobacterium undicola]MBA0884992.1 PAS domain S-box protein [Flavobacterium undicola]